MQRLGHVFGTVVVVCGVCVGVSATAQEAPTNWLKNPSLENAAGDRPAEWQTFTWGGAGSFEYDGVARSGQRSVALSSAQGADLSWGCIVPVDPYARYRLSGYIKTENVRPVRGRGVLLNVHNIQPVATRPMTGTNDWTLVEVEFETGEHDAIQVNCTLGAWGLASGKAWFDDLKLEQIARPHLPAPRITIDAGKVSAPLSPYIYGQFIEHLGRCIYGGIWAELLEDRKFFYPVGGRESPWQPVGGADAVRMQTAGALVGAHTPVVTLTDGAPRGLAQGDLGLVAGQEYVGRIWLAGTPESGPVQVSLVWGAAPAARQTLTIPDLTEEFTKRPLRFTAAASTDDARLEITAAGRGSFRVGTLSLMPADNVQGLRADTLALLKQLNAPIYRWPGGNFVSGYDWRDGIGDPDRRPPRKNPAWEGVEHNDFGIDEFLAFCRILKAEPYITVNSGLGDAAMAAAEVEYVNGAADTPMGQRRAANGHAKPYGVRFWAVGNEMYGNWQLGHMPLEPYTEKHNELAAAMRKADPSVRLVAVGSVGAWTEGMLKGCTAAMDLISEHFYCGQQPGLNGHVRQLANEVRRIATAHRGYRQQLDALRGKDIRIALDEWNYWYGPEVFGQIGTRYFVKDALGVAAGLHEFARQSDIMFMANYAQTVNVIGCIKTSKTAAAFETTGLILKLYRARFGTLPVQTVATPLLDAQAAWTADRKLLTLGVVNTARARQDVALNLRGAKLTGGGTRWELTGEPDSYNEPGAPPKVVITEQRLDGLADNRISVAPCSVTLFALPAEANAAATTR